jgi:predicted nucleic acid-binding protein
MKALFVDTAGWMSLVDGADPAHGGATGARDDHLRRGGLLVSTDYVLDETLTLIRARLGLDVARTWWDMADASDRLSWEWIGPARADVARALFSRWAGKGFSFTDCTSFVVMQQLRIRRALTVDRHFRQAGFETVP